MQKRRERPRPGSGGPPPGEGREGAGAVRERRAARPRGPRVPPAGAPGSARRRSPPGRSRGSHVWGRGAEQGRAGRGVTGVMRCGPQPPAPPGCWPRGRASAQAQAVVRGYPPPRSRGSVNRGGGARCCRPAEGVRGGGLAAWRTKCFLQKCPL